MMVHDILTASGLGHFYDLNRHPGVRIRAAGKAEPWACLDEPSVQERLLDFTDGKTSRVTFHVPAVHCVACVWLLENLFQLHPGIGRSQVHFPRREVSITFACDRIRLSEVAALLASLGYEPALTLGELDRPGPSPARRRLHLQLGIAGFAFGNIMLFSLPVYFGLDSLSGPLFRSVFGYLSLALALPVLVYSAADYWRSAWGSFRQRQLTLDVPIALGLAALFAQSAFEIGSGRGEGYLDSLTGLVFLLLCGRVFQQKTHERLAFDRDYKGFFPLAVTRKRPDGMGEECVAVSQLQVGDRLVLRHGELIPADATLLEGPALIDYSFVTGEAEAVPRQAGERLYAGGRQLGGAIEVELVKPVSQSYLTSLWDHEAFRKPRESELNNLTNRYSRRFTLLVVGIALGAAAYWFAHDAGRAVRAFTAVLIVACPCALALAAPFTFGTAQRLLARLNVFLRNGLVLERMAQVNTIVFDKTGTLTSAGGTRMTFCEPPGAVGGTPGGLTATEADWVGSLARHSTHPHAVRLRELLGAGRRALPVESFFEKAGRGLAGRIEGHDLRLGSPRWLRDSGVRVPDCALPAGSAVWLAVDGQCRGAFVLAQSLRPETDVLVRRLGSRYELALLSGDNERERERFRGLFGGAARLHFHQSPMDKLAFIQGLQHDGRTVMMVGDGLNDAGALRQSDAGVAVVERIGVFSPASDVILEASQVPRLHQILSFARGAVRIVRLGFAISALYNALGIGIAAAGLLSPPVCAVLMPVSSVSVVLFACGTTRWMAGRTGLRVN